MRRRRKRTLTVPVNRRPIGRRYEVCPYCGHTAHFGQGRIVDPYSERSVCVRCGTEIRNRN